MADPKCAVHEERLQAIESRLSRMEDDLESVISEQHRNATSTALAAQAVDLLKDMVSRLEARFESMETRMASQLSHLEQQFEGLAKNRWQTLAGLLANGAIGATSLGLFIWVVDKVLGLMK